jgi:ATP adenylyltransferase
MDRLFTPWRFPYVSSLERQAGPCVFCGIGERPEEDASTFVLERAADCFVVLNRYPYPPGHLLVVPYRHAPRMQDLPERTLEEMARLARRGESLLQRAFRPHGFNVGVNLGEAGGAGIEPHLHLHLVPRWRGDTSFMTVTGETRIMPQDLAETYGRLRPLFAAAGEGEER